MDAQTRRRERRAEKQAQWEAANPLLVGVCHLAWLLTSSWRVNHERTCIQSRHSSGRNDYSPTRKANAIERGIA